MRVCLCESWERNRIKDDHEDPYGQWYFSVNTEIHVNNVEYPQAPQGKAVIRFSLMPSHTREHLKQLVDAFDFASVNAHRIFETQMTKGR